jgi:hypothetical protein
MVALRTVMSAGLVLFLSSSVAFGQWTNPYTGTTWNNPTSSLIDTMLRGRMMRDLMIKEMARKGQPAKTAAAAPVRAAHVTYRPKASKVADAFAASLYPGKAERAELARFLQAALGVYAKEASKAGRKNDVGHALTYFVAGNYAIYNEQNVSDPATESLNLQMDQVLAGLDAKTSDEQRQQLAEQLVCAISFVLAGYQQGKEKGSAEQVSTFRALAGQYLKTVLEMEPGKIALTDAGLAQR